MRVDDEKATQLKQRLSPFGALTAHMEQEISANIDLELAMQPPQPQ